MKLKIHPDTSAAIEQALRDVNGCSQAHTFTEFSEISLLAETAEMELTRLDLPAVHRHLEPVGLLGDGHGCAGPVGQRHGAPRMFAISYDRPDSTAGPEG